MKTEKLGKYILSWPEGVFPLGGDALALGAFAPARPGWRVCDLGTGSGALLLLLAEREPSLGLYGVELDPLAAGTARKNLRQNGLAGDILEGDLRERPFEAEMFDLTVANPPYFPLGAGRSGGPARSEETCTLRELCRAAGRLTKNGGRFALCHRPERLTDLLCSLRDARLEPKRLRFVRHGPGHRPSLVLVEAVKNGGAGVEIEFSI